ncbi:MAG: hypothetical protein NTW19_06645 [Planctomycetota bacterium]|nr:hypothetical protein [Planctomycetota bacterium]
MSHYDPDAHEVTWDTSDSLAVVLLCIPFLMVFCCWAYFMLTCG